MSWFNNLPLQAKLLGSFAGVIVLMGTAAAFTVLALRQAVDDTGDIYNTHLAGLAILDDAKREFLLGNTYTMDALLADDPAEAVEIVEEAKGRVGAAQSKLNDFRAMQHDPEIIAKVDEALAGTTGLAAVREDIFEHIVAGRVETAIELNENGENGQPSGDEQAHAVVALLNDVTTMGQAAAASVYGKAKSDSSAATRNALIMAAVAAALGLGLGYLIARTIRRSVAEVVWRLESIQNHCVSDLAGGMRAFAAGDLTVTVSAVTPKVDAYTKDEVGRASEALNGVLDGLVSTIATYNEARQNLGGIVSGVRDGAAQLRSSADSLKDSSDQMASATGQIATAINEVTRSAVTLAGISQESAREVEQVATGALQLAASARSNAASAGQSKHEATQMSERIAYVAETSRMVAESAEESRVAAQQGQDAVGRAVGSMEAIAVAVEQASATVGKLGEYSQQIGDIVNAIDEIAAQTNLLALNAAIEAARAGEQGRGFAVVAENVRSLAERSSDSTKEIAELISRVQQATQEAVRVMETGVVNVHDGREVTARAGKALDSIIASVRESAVQMQQIAQDVQGLATGAERIVGSAETIAAMADESASGADAMAQGTSRVSDGIIQVSATSEQASASAEEVSASTEQLSAQSQELAATASEVKTVAEALEQAAARFRLA